MIMIVVMIMIYLYIIVITVMVIMIIKMMMRMLYYEFFINKLTYILTQLLLLNIPNNKEYKIFRFSI